MTTDPVKVCSCSHSTILHAYDRAPGEVVASPGRCLQPGCKCDRFKERPAVEEITGPKDAEDALQEAVRLLDQAVQHMTDQPMLSQRIQRFVNEHRRA